MKDTAVIMYTHTDYSDVWPLFFGQFEELFPFKDIPKYVFVDDTGTTTGKVPDDWQVLAYDDLDPYPARFSSCLKCVKEKYVLTHHEDMPLYYPPMDDILMSLPSVLKNTKKPFVKFTKAVETLEDSGIPGIMNITKNSSWLFSVQVGLWDRKILLDIYQNTGGINIWEFEVAAQMYLKGQDIYGCVWYDGETLRGLHHYDCKLYPHICTAVHKGKWTTNEYPELSLLLPKYGIDPSIRGEHQ